METYYAIVMDAADMLDAIGESLRAGQLRRIARDEWPTQAPGYVAPRHREEEPANPEERTTP